MFETLLVLGIILLAVAYIVRLVVRSVKSGECPSCKNCPCGGCAHRKEETDSTPK